MANCSSRPAAEVCASRDDRPLASRKREFALRDRSPIRSWRLDYARPNSATRIDVGFPGLIHRALGGGGRAAVVRCPSGLRRPPPSSTRNSSSSSSSARPRRNPAAAIAGRACGQQRIYGKVLRGREDNLTGPHDPKVQGRSPRLCRGGSGSLTFTAVRARGSLSRRNQALAVCSRAHGFPRRAGQRCSTAARRS